MAKKIPQEDKKALYDLVNEDIQNHIDYVSSYLGQTPKYVLSNHRGINFSEIQNSPSLSGPQKLCDLLGCSTGPIENITKKLESDLKNYRTFVLKSEARTGKTHSEDTIRKISGPNHHMSGRIGPDNPNHGKPRSEETKRKISEALTGENNPMSGRTGPNHPNHGKPRSEETKRKISEALTGKTHSEDTIRKISGPNHHMSGRTGPNHPNHGKPLSEEHRRKIAQTQTGKTHSEESKRKMSLAYLERMREFGDFIIPNFNPFACQLIEAYGIENGYNFIHALSPATEVQVTDKVRRNVEEENGQGIGECHIKITDEDGNVIEERWVDGYDPEKNVVIEFYEQFHKKQEEKDKIRQNTIQDFLGCKFIILREGSDEVNNLEDRLGE